MSGLSSLYSHTGLLDSLLTFFVEDNMTIYPKRIFGVSRIKVSPVLKLLDVDCNSGVILRPLQ